MRVMRKFHLKLYPINEHVKPYEIPFGHIFQGVIFGWLHEKCPKLTHELHSYNEIRPYSINCYIHRRDPLVEFSIVSYNQSLSAVLYDIIYSIKKQILDIAGKQYEIQGLKTEEIHLEDLMKASAPVRHFHISFVTPVYFRTPHGDYPIRFPMPSLLISNILKIWNILSKETSPLDSYDLIRWVDIHCFPSGYKMKTSKYYIRNTQTVAGGLGFVSCRINKPNTHYYKKHLALNRQEEDKASEIDSHYRTNCQWIDLLCRVAEYTNVGGNRTAGMGVIKYYPKSYLNTKQSTKLIPPSINTT